MLRYLCFAAFLFTVPFLQGCDFSITRNMWELAKFKTVSDPEIIGLLRPDPQTPSEPSKLIVMYSAFHHKYAWQSNKYYFVLVQLKPDGNAISPLGYDGPDDQWCRFGENVSEKTIAEISQTQFHLLHGDEVRQFTYTPDLPRINSLKDGIKMEDCGGYSLPMYSLSIRYLAYRIADGTYKDIPFDIAEKQRRYPSLNRDKPYHKEPNYRPEVHVVFLPMSQPRPPGDEQ